MSQPNDEVENLGRSAIPTGCDSAPDAANGKRRFMKRTAAAPIFIGAAVPRFEA